MQNISMQVRPSESKAIGMLVQLFDPSKQALLRAINRRKVAVHLRSAYGLLRLGDYAVILKRSCFRNFSTILGAQWLRAKSLELVCARYLKRLDQPLVLTSVR